MHPISFLDCLSSPSGTHIVMASLLMRDIPLHVSYVILQWDQLQPCSNLITKVLDTV